MEKQIKEDLLEIITKQYNFIPGKKTESYINAFFAKTKKGNSLAGSVEGNHGTYKVSIRLKGRDIVSGCSYYIGKHGGCYHTNALALNFKADPSSFKELKIAPRTAVKDLATLRTYLKDEPLENLIDELKTSKGITQAAFAKSIGRSSQHLGAVKKAENRNRHFKELGAIKLACLYVLERKKIKK